MKASIATLIALPLAVLVLTGCSAGESTKAGGEAAPVTLRIGTNDTPGRPGSDQIEEFARRVTRLSDGKLRIQPVWEAAGPGQTDWDQKVARLVVNGKIDLGMIPTRAFDTEGVKTLRALSAPFLVTSDDLSSRIASSDLARDLLAGLEEIDLVGLALVPEGLRHPFAYAEPLLSPEDYDGALIRAPTSDVTTALFEALGATADDLSDTALQEAVSESAVAAAESSFFWATSIESSATTVTGNVTFFPKVNSIVINRDAFDDLSDDQQEVLRQAAERTRDWAIAELPSDAAAAATYCESGGTVVLASDDDLAALEEAATAVYAELERDATTKSLIDRIRELKTEVSMSASAVEACSSDPAPAADSDEGDPGSLPDGVYRIEVTDDDLRKGGVTNAGDLLENHGIYTWTLSGGKWHFDTRAPNKQNDASQDGTYTVDGDRVTFVWTDAHDPPPHEFRWSVGSDGSLHLTPLGNPDPITATAMGAHPWKRIADVEATEAQVAEAPFPQGVYRLSYTVDFLVERGLDRGAAFDQAGVQTLTFENGGFLHQIKGKPPECRGTYAVEDGRVALVIAADESPGCGSEDWEIFNARWTLEGDELRFVDVASQLDEDAFVQIIWGSKPWRKIG